ARESPSVFHHPRRYRAADRGIDRFGQHLGAALSATATGRSTPGQAAAADRIRRPNDGGLPTWGILRRRTGHRQRGLADVRDNPETRRVVVVSSLVANAFRP